MNKVKIDLTPLVASIVDALAAPHNAFLDRLRSENRITDAEMETLREEVLKVVDHLPEVVRANVARMFE